MKDTDRSIINRLYPVRPETEDRLITAMERVEDAALTGLTAIGFVVYLAAILLAAVR